MPLIELNAVTKSYRSGSQTVVAVDDFSITVERGAFLVLAGPSGSGKTTLLNLIGCLDLPEQGEIILDGKQLTHLSAQQRADIRLHQIGFIFQSYNLVPVLTAFENAEFTLMLQGVEKSERQRRVRHWFAELGLEGLEQRRPANLSGGQQQRVAIARAMASDPAVILADEPTANLDSHASEELLALMQQLNQQRGATFIFSSHDPLVIGHGKRVVRLIDGRLESDSWAS